MRIFLDQSVSVGDPAQLSQALKLLREDAAFLRGSYPDFDSWLFDKVLPGIVNGERTFLIEMRANEVAGFMILKHSLSEKSCAHCAFAPNTRVSAWAFVCLKRRSKFLRQSVRFSRFQRK